MSARAYLLSLEQIGIKLGLDQITALVAALDRPDAAYRSIVVAGTNGKGSVTAMVERGLRAAGYRTGRFTSPHLVDLEERFVIDGSPISADALEGLARRIEDAAMGLPAPPSFFEATTALALEAFREARVDVAVLEVGLGGRLDATNVVRPVGVAITAVDFDHEQYLGHTLEAIAREKAGVIKPGAVVALARNPEPVRQIVAGTCARTGATYIYGPEAVAARVAMADGRARLDLETTRHRLEAVTLGLRGRHQVDNAVVAVALLEALTAKGIVDVPPEAERAALADVVWPGRLELVDWRGRHVLIDGAHNPAGARALAAHLAETYGRLLPLVVGVMRDKKIDEILGALAPAASHFFLTAPATPRAAAPADLAAVAGRVAPGVPAHTVRLPIDAVTRAAALGDPVVVAGSLFLAGDVRAAVS
jgi:dihydrofolate synthase / folylpolyglutamate synthase